MKPLQKTRFLATGAVIAALYAALTLLANAMGLAIGLIEIRFSEALCILPMLTPAAVPGLFVGCIVANLLCGAAIWDVLFGSLATLIAAIGTRLWRNKRLLPYLCPILSNTLVIPPILYFAYGLKSFSLPLLVLVFLAGETLSAGVLGFLLNKAVKPFEKIFR